MGWGGRWEEGSGWGTHVNPWLIHVNVWQKPLQYCKVINLQLIKINGKKKPHYNSSLFAVPPVIKDKELVTNVSVLVNQPTSLFCEVEGAPSPIIMWYKDDVQVNGDIHICVHLCLCL